MIGQNPEDILTHQDKIYKFYFDKEHWIKKQVNLKNRDLKSFGKPTIELGLFDVLPETTMYDDGKEVLLLEHILKNPTQIQKKFVEIPRSIYGIYYMPEIEKSWHRNIVKDFNCFINRNDPIRQSWFYLLYDRSLLDHCFASFSGLSRYKVNDLNNLDYFDKNHQEHLTSFDSIYTQVRQLVPYKNFVETGDLCDTILQTKFSVVIETYFERPDAITFSEKTFRVLQTPRPWLLFHTTGSIQELRDMGFYVYDDFLDHSYDAFDTSTSSVDRQESILEQTKNLLSLDVTQSMIDYWEKMTLKNCKLLKDLNQTWQQDVERSIEQAYNLALL